MTTLLGRMIARLASRACGARGRSWRVSAALGLVGLLCACAAVPAVAPDRGDWVGSWAASPSLPVVFADPPPGFPAPPPLEGTLRYTMRISAGGERARVAISGGLAVETLSIDAATIGVVRNGRLDAASLTPLLFGGARGVIVQSGTQIRSDAADLSLAAGDVVAVSLHLTQPAPATQADPQLVVEMAPGADQTSEPALDGATTLTARPLVTGIEVENAGVDRVIVAFGDSITDGTAGTDPLVRGWPDALAARLRAAGIDDVAVVNAGIGGNRILQSSVGESALVRFDRDALTVPGVTDVILLEGINDIGLSGLPDFATGAPRRVLSADDIFWAYQQLIDRAHDHGVRVIGATITPVGGGTFPGYATPEKDVIREEINAWIRTSGAFDAVIDFDAAIRDPEQPSRILPAYDSGDHVHPSDAGYGVMAEAIDLELFQ